MMTKTIEQKRQIVADRIEQTQKLRDLLNDEATSGMKLYTVVTSVARSGMSRSIMVLMIDDDGISDVSWRVAKILGLKLHQRQSGVVVHGCGMDMTAWLVMEVSHRLYADSYRITRGSL